MISKPPWIEDWFWRRCVEQRLALSKQYPQLYQNEFIPDPLTPENSPTHQHD